MALPLELRSAALVVDAAGHQQWRESHETRVLDPSRTALLLCDVWNDHTSRGAVERLEAIIPAMAAVVEALRADGVTIVHCPSDCMDFYAASRARKRVLALRRWHRRRIWSTRTRRCPSTPRDRSPTPTSRCGAAPTML